MASKLINLEECFFPELLADIYEQVKIRRIPLTNVDRKYGVRLSRLISKQTNYDYMGWIDYGGEALVVHCRERRGLRRDVAVKIAAPFFNAPGLRSTTTRTAKDFDIDERNEFGMRFRRGMAYQQQIAEEVSFEFGAIPRVYEMCRKPLYFVMEFIHGVPLNKWAPRAPVKRRLLFFRDILKFIDELHLHYIIHRDLKPNNIIIRQGRPVLIDLTVAKSVEDLGSDFTAQEKSRVDEAQVTSFTVGMGSRAYAAPEMLIDISQADTRSDIFALGKILEFLWTKLVPVRGERLPAALKDIYDRATQYDKQHRYRLISHMVDDYEAALKTLEITEDELDLEALFEGCQYKKIAMAHFISNYLIAKGLTNES